MHAINCTCNHSFCITCFKVLLLLLRFVAIIQVTCINWHPRLRTGGFFEQSFNACMPLLMASTHSDYGEDARCVTCTTSIPSLTCFKQNQKYGNSTQEQPFLLWMVQNVLHGCLTSLTVDVGRHYNNNNNNNTKIYNAHM